MPPSSTATRVVPASNAEPVPACSERVHATPKGEHRPVRVVVFNDHPVFKSALSWKLSHEHDIEFVADTVSLGETLNKVAQEPGGPIDVVVADLRIGDGNSEGVDSVQTLTTRLAGVPIIAYSDYCFRSFAMRMNEAGAAAIVQKSATVDELVAAIHAVVERTVENRPPRVSGSAA